MQLLLEPCLKYLSIELTNHCQLKCAMCWSQNPHLNPLRPKGYMSQEHYRRVLSEIQACFDPGDMLTALSYAGESTLHPQFADFAEEAHALNFKRLQLATNGLKLRKYAKVLAECFDELAVSYHKTPYLTRVIEDTKLLYKETRRTGCAMRINVVMQEFTVRELGKLRRMTMEFRDRFKQFPMITEDMHLTGPGYFEKQVACPMLFFYLAICWNGETLPCCHMLSPGTFSLGNVFNSSITNVFHGSFISNLRRGNLADTPCQSCNLYK